MASEGQKYPVLGAADAITASLLLFAVWGALPARWWPLDAAGTTLAVLFLLAGFGMSFGTGWGRTLGLWAAGASLVVGCVLITVLAFTATELSGLYGPVGRGASIILSIVYFLLAPYLVMLPTAQLFVLLGERRATSLD